MGQFYSPPDLAKSIQDISRRVGLLEQQQMGQLLTTVARGSGGFSSDVQGQLVIFGASIVNTGAGIGSEWGVGVDTVTHTGTGIVQVTLTETFPTDTVFGVTLPRYGVGATPIGTTATTMRVSATDATSITFQALNSAGTLVDSHFYFVGAGTLAL